ncbi:exosortase/archaeosortase family protein [Candidatus Micrarchaeota archaeon]|nr:exosortase/archaeosortase family protein [Candidatus Micrarchaeota archaeon]
MTGVRHYRKHAGHPVTIGTAAVADGVRHYGKHAGASGPELDDVRHYKKTRVRAGSDGVRHYGKAGAHADSNGVRHYKRLAGFAVAESSSSDAVRRFKRALEGILFKQAGESAAGDGLKFLALFAAVSLVSYSLLSLTGNFLNEIAAYSGAAVLSAFGASASVSHPPGDAFPHIEGSVGGNVFDAQIGGLCSGAVELAVLAGIVLASRDRPLRKRAWGFLLGALVFLFFNPLRIALTLLAVGSWALPLLHDVLFRVTLVIAIVAYYAVWHVFLSSPPSSRASRRGALGKA